MALRIDRRALLAGAGAALAARAAAAAEAPRHETGVLKPGEGFREARNMYPTLSVLPDGRLLLVWTSVRRIVGSFSTDHGKSWSAEFPLIDVPGHLSADPTIIVTKTAAQVHSTTVPSPRGTSLTSEIWMTALPHGGRAWSAPARVPGHRRYMVGMIHAGLQLPDGTLVKPYAWDVPAEQGFRFEGEGKMYLRSGALRSTDDGKSWQPGADISAEPPRTSDFSTGGVCEPAMVLLENGELYCLMRTADTHHWEARSRDGGLSWNAAQTSPVVGHNTPSALCRLRGGTEVLLVWNNSPRSRWPLDAALSRDGCRTWSPGRTLANPQGVQASYPTCAQAADGTLVAVWQQDWPDRKGRDLRVARFSREWLLEA